MTRLSFVVISCSVGSTKMTLMHMGHYGKKTLHILAVSKNDSNVSFFSFLFYKVLYRTLILFPQTHLNISFYQLSLSSLFIFLMSKIKIINFILIVRKSWYHQFITIRKNCTSLSSIFFFFLFIVLMGTFYYYYVNSRKSL